MLDIWPTDAIDGFLPLAGRALVPMQRFENVVIQPARGRGMSGAQWPSFARQNVARHWRGPNPVDGAPSASDQPVTERIEDTAVWCGVYESHFGHFMAEFISRVPQAREQHPNATYLFNTLPEFDRGSVPVWFWQALEWFGVLPGQVRFVSATTEVAELWVAPQNETLGKAGVGEAYLDLLSAHAARQGLPTTGKGTLYVARSSGKSRFGCHAGEAYLVSCLESLGVDVFHPETVSLPQQLARYSEAGTLIFAEGSALHGRQMLGALEQDIVVLIRRMGQRLALNNLRNRCNRLAYAKTVAGALHFLGKDGTPRLYQGISLYDVTHLLAVFDAFAIPLTQVWDTSAYNAARDADILAWIAEAYDPGLAPALRPYDSTDLILNGLAQNGLSHLNDMARAHMAPGPRPDPSDAR